MGLSAPLSCQELHSSQSMIDDSNKAILADFTFVKVAEVFLLPIQIAVYFKVGLFKLLVFLQKIRDAQMELFWAKSICSVIFPHLVSAQITLHLSKIITPSPQLNFFQ